jgi:uncharacterized OB-fold protein
MPGHILPVADEISAPYWEACARHVLTLPRCSDCGEFTLPPDISCPNCRSLDPRFVFVEVAGRGRIRTWTVIRHSFLSGFELPFLLVDVQLEEQPEVRMIGRLVDGPDVAIAIGDPVAVTFDDLAPGMAVPAFRLTAAA